MSLFERLYWISPIPIQNVLLSVYGWRLRRARYDVAYWRALRHYKEKDYSSRRVEEATQCDELKRLLVHAKANSKFYAELYRDVDLSGIRHVEDLARLPIVEKEVLRANIDDVYTITRPEGIEAFTGGTTGKSLRVYFTKEDAQKRMAYLDAFKGRCGIDPFKAKKATFSGRSVATGMFQKRGKTFWRMNYGYRQRLYSTFDINEETLPFYVKDLNRFRPDVINGFVSAIHQIAQYINHTGQALSFVPRAIFTTSETLLPHHREAIEAAFKARVFDQYASAEGAPFVTECVAGRLHFNIDTGVLETMYGDWGPESLVTSFTSYGTPLIRYRIGDYIVVTDRQDCACGSCHPVVDRIEGRRVDFLYSSKGTRVSLSHLADVIKGLPNCVRQMQFVQEDMRRVGVKVVADAALFGPAAEKKVREAMGYRFGPETAIEVHLVDSIPKESSGKTSLIKNLIATT